jgi:purine-nucleoside phosphorylase
MTAPLAFDDAVAQSAARVLGSGRKPRIAVLLGSGWHDFSATVRDPVTLGYADLPAFPELQIAGHAGTLVLGRCGRHEVVVLAGRKHAYEHGEAQAMKGAIATMAACGVQVLVQTNAAGSLEASMRPGALMLLADHLNIVQRSPLHGETGSERFVDLRNAYDPALRTQAHAAAQRRGATLHEGVYAWVLGPQFETPAEIRMLQRLGAQAVGMSTVPETILARRYGLRVLALSMITNMGCGLHDESLSHAHTLASAQAAGAHAVPLLHAIVEALEI